MKVIIEYEYNFDEFKILGVKDLIEYYEKYFKDKGVFLCKDSEAIYYEVEIPQLPIEGQRIGCKFGQCIVTYSYYDVDMVSKNYFDKTRIVVSEE